MKRICAWCEKLMGYKCPFCGEELRQPERPDLQGLYMECPGSGPYTNPTVMHQSGINFSIERMQITSGMCQECQEKLIIEKKGAPQPPSEAHK
jgi:hypothetical protein